MRNDSLTRSVSGRQRTQAQSDMPTIAYDRKIQHGAKWLIGVANGRMGLGAVARTLSRG